MLTITVQDGPTVIDNGMGSDDFGTTTMGVPVQKTFTIYNSSGNDISLYGLSSSLPQGFSLVDNYFPSDVPPDGSATFVVQMDADSLSSPYGQLSFSDDDPDSGGYYSFNISGTVNPPAPAITVKDGATLLDNGMGSDDFGTTAMGVPVQKTFTIYNSSGNDISLYGLSNGLPQGFSLVNNNFPSDVPAYGSTTFIVQMDADSVGSPYGQLAFSDGDPGGGYYSFNISGTVNEAAAAPILSLSDGATSLPSGSSDSFGTVAFGAAVQKTFTVTNSGGATLSVSSISLPAGFALQTSLPLNVNPYSSTTFVVSMDTSSAGAHSGQMTLTSNDAQHSPLTVTLSGTVSPSAPHIVLAENGASLANGASDAFPNTFAGVPESKTFTIQNTGTATLTIDSLQWPAGFTLTASPAASVAPGNSTSFTLRLDATAAGTASGQISFGDNDAANNPFHLNISANVLAPSVSVGSIALVNDTGLSSTDRISSDPRVTAAVSGNFSGGRADVEFQASTDGGVSYQADGTASVTTSGGTFAFDPRTALSALSSYEGPLTLQYRPLEYDSHGNLVLTGSWSAFAFTLVSAAAPQAHDDSYSVSHASSLAESAAQGVAGNDTDGDGGTLVVQLISDVQHGSLTLNSDGSFNYTPAPGYLGADSFSYQLHDGADISNVALVSLVVTNALPVASDDQYEVVQDHAATPDQGVLANDTDADGDPLSATLLTSVSHGVLNLHADGTFTYTPDAGFLGSDSFTYEASDAFGSSNAATVTFDVNDASAVARNDSYSTLHGVTLGVAAPGVLSNDGFAGGPALTVSLVSGVSHGSLTLNSDGSFQYIPAPGFAGDDSFTYQATDGGSETGNAGVTIHVTNAAPAGLADDYSGFHDRTLVVGVATGVLSNDADADGDALTALLVSGPVHGDLTLNADGSFSYEPAAGYAGDDSFTYEANDGIANSPAITVSLHATNTPPESDNDYYVANHDQTLAVPAGSGVLANDSDNELDALSAQLVAGPAHGSLTLNADGSFSYTPAAGYLGPDSFTYQAWDGVALGAVATVSLDVVNHAPHVYPNSYQIGHDRTLTVSAAQGVLSVDSDPETDPLTATLAVGPASGQLSLSADGSFTYTPNAGFVGTDQFTYIASDGLLQTSPVTITIQVTNTAPTVQDDSYSLLHDTPLSISAEQGVLSNDQDLDGDAISAILVSSPSSGTVLLGADGSFTYTPNAGFQGTDHFTYRVTDGATTSNLAAVTLNVANPAPTAQNDAFSVLHDTTLTVAAARGVLLNDSDPDGESLTVLLDASVAHGTLTLATDGSFSYVPTAGFVGTDSFTYHTSDGHGASDPATVTLTVTDQSPSAPDASFSTLHDHALAVTAANGLLSGANDPDGDALTVTLQSDVSHGTLSLAADGSFSYTPTSGYVGTDSFTFTVNDGAEDSAEATVTIDVTDNAPLAVDDSYSLGHDQTLTVSASSGVLSNDSDADSGDTMIAQLMQQADNGTVTLQADGSFVYVPNPGFHGTDLFTYQASDGILASGETTVTINVDNSGPTATPDSYSVIHDRTLSIPAAQGVLANDTDPNGDSLVATLIAGVNHGTLTLQADGSLTYVPSAGYVGADGFSYRVSDGTTNSDAVDVSFDVTNQAPTAVAGSYAVNQDQTLIVTSGNALSGASDPDGDALTAQLVSGPSHGTLTLQSNGNFTYVPDSGYSGSDSFSVAADDGIEQSAPVTMAITVNHINRTPVVPSSSFTVHANHDLSGNVLSGASDADGDPLTVTLVSGASHGTVTLNSDGSFAYSPTNNYVGSDGFSFTVSDGTAMSDAIAATIDVANAAPVALDTSYITYLTTSLNVFSAGGLLAHATDADNDPLTATLVSGPANGTLTLNADGSFSYTANVGFTGTDTFSYAARDGIATSNTATVAIQVTDNSVIAAGESYSVVHDRTLTTTGATGVLRNDWAVDGGAISAELVSGPAHGSLQLAADGSFQYLPDLGYVGADQFVYRVTEGEAASQNVTAQINVTNVVPVTAGDHYSVLHDTSLAITQQAGVLANDYDENGDAMTVQLVSGPSHGNLTLYPDGSFTYTPVPGYVGDDGFTYEVVDGAGTSLPATATISVTDHAPSGQGVSYSMHHGQSLSVAAPGVRAFDYDYDADATSIVLVSSTSHGALTLNQDGSFSYAPNELSGGRDFVGSDSFTYQLFDGALYSVPITISINVADLAPKGNGDFYSAHFNSAVSGNVLTNDVDPDGDPIKAVQLSQPLHGTATVQSDGSFTYSPTPPINGEAAYVGVDSFTYEVDDHGLFSLPVIVTIDLRNTAPVAAADLFQVQHGDQLSGDVLANDWDADSDELQAFLASGSGPLHAKQFQFNSNGTFTYTPADGFAGTDTFSYRIGDGANYSAFVTTTIQVANAAAYAVNDFVHAFSGQTIGGNVLVNAQNADGDSLSVSLASAPSHGELTLSNSGDYVYQADGDYDGADSFTYQISDGINTSQGTVYISVVAPIVKAEDDSYAVDQSTGSLAVTTSVFANDITTPGVAVTSQVVTQPQHGNLVFHADGSFTYTPNQDFAGEDAFQYEVVAPGGATSTATVSINVIQQPPTANDASFTADEGSSLSISSTALLASDDGHGGTLTTPIIVTQPGHGTLTWNVDHWVYQSDPDFHGVDSFQYVVKDGAGEASNPARVTLTVNRVAQPVIAVPDGGVTTRENQPVTIDVLANDLAGNEPLDAGAVVSLPSSTSQGGSIAVVDNKVVYTPNLNWSGADHFNYNVTDAAGRQSQATVNVSVTAVDTMTAQDMSANAIENLATGFSLPQAVMLETRYVEVISPPSHGTVKNFTTGNFGYLPDPDFVGDDSFEYKAYDSNWNSATGTITIHVGPGSDLPKDNEPPPGSFNESPQPEYTTNDPMLLMMPEWQSSVDIAAGDSFTSARYGITVHNNSAGAVHANFGPAHVGIAPIEPIVDDYDLDIEGVSGYVDAAWGGPPVRTLAMSATGSIAGVDLPGTLVAFLAGNAIGDVTAGTVYEMSSCGVGAVVASGNVAISTGGGVPSVQADGDIGFIDAYEIDGPVTAQGVIGAILAVDAIKGPIRTSGAYLGWISTRDLLGDVTADSGDIGFGDVPEWAVNVGYFAMGIAQKDGIFAPGVTASRSLSGSISAPEGRIAAVHGGKITSPSIHAQGDIYLVEAADSIKNSQITSDMGCVSSVSVGRGGISQASVKAALDIGGGTPDTVEVDTLYGVAVTPGVGSAGPVANTSIQAGEDIVDVAALDVSAATIKAAGAIDDISVGNSFSGTIQAGGDIGRISNRDGIWPNVDGVQYFGGLSQDISGTITAGGNIGALVVGRDLTATVKAVDLPSIIVGRDSSGPITASGDIGSVGVGRTISKSITGSSIATVQAGYDIASGANITSNQGIESVVAGHTLAGNVKAQGGDIGQVAAGSGYPNSNTSDGAIDGATILASGSIGSVAAIAGPGYGGIISGATITAQAGDIGSVTASGGLDAEITAQGSVGNVSAGAVNGGSLDGEVVAKTGNIGAVSSADSISATLTARDDIGSVTAGANISGAITAGHSIPGGVKAGRNISGDIKATSGDIGELVFIIIGVSAGAAISGDITAGHDIGGVWAGAAISGDVHAGADLGDVVAGTSPAGGNISGNLSAGGSIGDVTAWGGVDTKGIDSSFTPRGLVGQNQWWLQIILGTPFGGSYLVTKPDGEPSDGAGNISGTIQSGLSLGKVTAYGKIEKQVSSGTSMGRVWALSDVSGDIKAGAGSLQVDSWGTISGALTALGGIVAGAYDDISGNVLSDLAGVALTAWGDIKGAVESRLNATLWALGDIMSPSVVSEVGEAVFTAFGSIVDMTCMGSNFFVTFAGNVEGCTFTSDLSSTLTGNAEFRPGPALFYVWGDITGTTIDVAYLAGLPGNVPNPFGYVSIIAGGNVSGTTIKAAVGVDVLAGNSAMGDTIDTSAGAPLAAGLQSGGNLLSGIGSAMLMPGTILPALFTKLWGALLTGIGDEIGFVVLMAEKGADATVTSPTCIQVATLHAAGTYTGKDVEIDAWNGADLGTVEGSDNVDIFVHGSLSGAIDSSDGTVEIETSGDVTATVSGKWSASVKTAGSCSGAVTSASGPVAIDAYGNVSSPINGKVFADVHSWTGEVSGTINTSGYAKINAGGGSTANVTAGGNVVIVSLADVSGTIKAGDGALDGTWVADIDAEGNVSGEITASDEVSIEANGDISAKATSTYSTVELDAAGNISSPTVHGAGDVTLLGAMGINVGEVTSDLGSLFLRSGSDITLTGGSAATWAGVLAGGNADATLTMNGSTTTATITAVRNVTANVTGNGASVAVSAGGAANVEIQGEDGGVGPASVSVVSMGALQGSIEQAGDVGVTGWGGVNLTAGARNSISVLSGAGLQGTFTSGGILSAEAQGAVSGSYIGADGGVTVVGKTSVDGQVKDLTAGAVTVASLGNVGASVTAALGDAFVNSGGAVSGAVSAGDDANVSALGGAVSGTVTAAHNAGLLAKQGVTAAVQAGQDASLVAFGDVSSSVTAVAGAVVANVYAALSGPVSAGTTATVYADSAEASVTAGGDATVTSKNTITGEITAGGNANVSSVQGVQSEIQATGAASVFAVQDVAGAVDTTNGDVTINCGASLSSTINSGRNANLVSLGEFSSTVIAGGAATITGWSNVGGSVTTQGGDAVLYANGNLSTTVDASASANATVVGDVTGDITASANATVRVGGRLSGQIDAGGDVSVTSGGECSGTIHSGANATIDSLGDITSQVIAGGNANLDTWSNINSDNVQAGGSATLAASGNLTATIKALSGAIDAETMGTAQVIATAQGDITLDSLGAVSATTLTSHAGSVDVEVNDNATLTVQADQNASILVTGDLNGAITTTHGDIEVDSLGALTGTFQAGRDAALESLGDASGVTITAARYADLTTFGSAMGISVSGDLDASAWAGEALSGSVTSAQGDVGAESFAAMNVTANAGGGAFIMGLSDVQADVTSGAESDVGALGNLSGPVRAGTNAYLFSGGNLAADVIAGGDAILETIDALSGTVHAGHDLGAASYGDLDATDFHAGHDVTLIWARGDITGSYSADGAIDQVVSYGSINASLVAPTIVSVAAFGPVGGSFTASLSIESVASGGAITAALNSPSIGSVSPYLHGLLSDWPATPVLSDSADIAQRDEARAELQSLAAQMAADKSAALAALPAEKAAAAPSFAVSIGDLAAATAWFQNAGMQLAAQIAAAQYQDQLSLSAAQTALTAYFSSEDARLAAARAGNLAFFETLKGSLAKITADRESEAVADEAAAQVILQAAASDRAAMIQKLDHTRDYDWPLTFEKKLLEFMLDRLQNVLDIIGIIEPTPFADSINAIISAARGKYFDAGINALGIIPYLGDLAKLGKLGKLGKFADDGLAALRRVAGDFLNVAAKGVGYVNACDAAAQLGRLGKKVGELLPIGCFGADTEIVMANADSESLGAAVGAEWVTVEDPEHDRWLWASLLAGAGFAGYWAANRAQRRKQEEEDAEQAALDQLFTGDDEIGDRNDGLEMLVTARQTPANRVLSPAACAAFAECSDYETPFDLETSIRAGAQFQRNPAANESLSDAHYPRSRNGETSMNTPGRSPTRPKKRGQASARPTRGRSRLGVAWLSILLGLAAWVGFGPSVSATRLTTPPTAASVAASPAAESQSPATRRIADVRVGDRVKANNPTGDEDLTLGAEVDPASWRKLVLRASKQDGTSAEVELLRPLAWIEERGAKVGGTAPISVPECGINGDADVLAIEPCPPIMPGDGRVVTGTFHHASARVMDLAVEGLESPIVTTSNHLFWSADRERFIRADALQPGEHVVGSDGPAAVASATPRHDGIPVYNLEVHVDHAYRVSSAGVIVHNSADDCWRLGTDIIGPPIDAVKAGYRAKYLAADPSLPSGWQVHHSIPQRYQQLFADIGIDIHHLEWLRGVDPKVHSKITAEWELFHRRFGGNPTAADVAKFVREIENKYRDYLRWPGF